MFARLCFTGPDADENRKRHNTTIQDLVRGMLRDELRVGSGPIVVPPPTHDTGGSETDRAYLQVSGVTHTEERVTTLIPACIKALKSEVAGAYGIVLDVEFITVPEGKHLIEA